MQRLVYDDVRERPDLSAADVANPDALIRRDRLVSAMLQDRNVVRILSAPHGFGKTALAYEYASRMFAGSAVWWVQAESPDFLGSLDDKSFGSWVESATTALVVVDGLPYLDEQRAETLSAAIDGLLYRGVEVVVTTLPSQDCLRTLQPQRILIRAPELLVSQQECKPRATASTAERASLTRAWRAAGKKLFGRVPCVFWGRGREDQEYVLRGLFDEQLPRELFACVFGMMLLGSGGFEDLERIGCTLRAENERLLANDYPLFDFDATQRTFSVQRFDYAALYDIVCRSDLSDVLLRGTYPVAQRALAQLFAKGDVVRAERVLENFCSDEQCALWLRDWGWELLNGGGLQLVDSLFDRAPLASSEDKPMYLSLRAWTSGLAGNWREASYYARRSLELARSDAAREERCEAALAAYLALLAFGNVADKAPFGQSAAYGPFPSKPFEFLASVVDACTGLELARALSIDDAERSKLLGAQREDAPPERVDRLRAMFTEASAQLKGDPLFHLALHLLNFVDSSELRALVQELGCDAIVAMRSKGLHSIVEALLVRDLWYGGYFGPMGRTVDKHDAELLESASRMLKEMGLRAGYDNVRIPWEVGSIMDAPAPSVYVRGATLRNQELVPLMKVRLFGGFEVTLGDDVIKERRWRRKSRLLFCELVLRQGRDIARDDILSLLWPGMARTKALDNFYNLWSSLCSVVGGEPYLERSGEFCRINPRHVVSDVSEFEQLNRGLLLMRGDARELLDAYARIEALYSGGLLPCEAESAFVSQQRARFKSMYTDSMVAATAKALETNDARLALWFARKAMEVERGREDVYYALISAQVAAGQRCSAIRTYFECKEFLREELGLDPSYETQGLYDSLIAMDPSLLRLTPAALSVSTLET